jgi:hypothetical protein
MLSMGTSLLHFSYPLLFIECADLRHHIYHVREMYGTWKAECQKMVPAIGSGKFITAPIITDGGQTNEESSTNGDLRDQNGVMSTHLPDSSLDCGGHVNNVVSDNKVIQWKLTLHQIGIYALHRFICY